jgi:REP element-mobilizing transposase RayT
MRSVKKCGFSHGPFVYAPQMRFAPQETRTYLVTAVTAGRRSLFQVSATAQLLQHTILDYRSQGKSLLHAFVIMPGRFHALTTPAPDVSLEKAMQFRRSRIYFAVMHGRRPPGKDVNRAFLPPLNPKSLSPIFIADNIDPAAHNVYMPVLSQIEHPRPTLSRSGKEAEKKRNAPTPPPLLLQPHEVK